MCQVLHATLILNQWISVQHNISHRSNYIFLEAAGSWEEKIILAGLHHVSTLVTSCKVDSVPSSNIELHCKNFIWGKKHSKNSLDCLRAFFFSFLRNIDIVEWLFAKDWSVSVVLVWVCRLLYRFLVFSACERIKEDISLCYFCVRPGGLFDWCHSVKL